MKALLFTLFVLTLLVITCVFMWSYGKTYDMWYTDGFAITGNLLGWGGLCFTLISLSRLVTDK